jgi:endonuclease/exonuclease/phosphatase family metal-dependent hydrolase
MRRHRAKRASTLLVEPSAHLGAAPRHPDRLRLVSYNLKSCLLSSVEQLGTVLERLEPDVVALQEVDRFLPRSGELDQAAHLAARLEMRFAFAATLAHGDGHYGIALLSRLPIRQTRRWSLRARLASEPRASLDMQLALGPEADAPTLRVVVLHADFLPWAAGRYAAELLRVCTAELGRGLLLAGDLNATPRRRGPRLLRAAGFHDLIAEHGEAPTFVWRRWRRRIDYVFADDPVAAATHAVEVPAIAGSDHRPVVVDLELSRLSAGLR